MFQLQSNPHETPIMNNGVIAAVPISYKLADESIIYTISYTQMADGSTFTYNPLPNNVGILLDY